ncbi:YjeF N-terminal domain-containing protein [Syncephalis fuscata]|nr:YjeF N-terminal domain-containing protein [Syncephalis fuscata]
MTEAFIGLTVEIKLNDGFTIQGVVSMVDPTTQRLQLEHVFTTSPHGIQRHWPVHQVAGEHIVDLRIIEKTPSTSNYGRQAPSSAASSMSAPLNLPPDPAIISTNRPPIPPNAPFSANQPLSATPVSVQSFISTLDRSGLMDSTPALIEKTSAHLRQQGHQTKAQSIMVESNDNNDTESILDRATTPFTEATDSDVPIDIRARPTRKKRNNKTVRRPRMSHRRMTSDTNEWAQSDVNDFIEEDFDFQQNLVLFDKKKVFEEIRETDSTAPEDRLVSHNRRDQRVRNLLPSENVLSRVSLEEETDNGSDIDTWRDNGDHNSYTFKTTDGAPCWAVTGVQMLEVERMAEQMIENGGRSAASLCLQVMGGSRRVLASNHNDPPLVIILAGNNKSGAYGLAAGRHLLNHGCEVVACTVGKERQLSKHTRQQQSYLRASGVNHWLYTIYDLLSMTTELPSRFTQPVDLIIDALLGYQYTYANYLMNMHAPRSPVLSLDMPSGIDGTTGLPGDQDTFITPRWTLCMGAPKTGLTGLGMSGEVFLADLGLPRILWKRVGVPGWTVPPWGADFVIGLQYA